MEITNANWKEVLLRQGVELDCQDKVVFEVNGKVYSYRVESECLQIISPSRFTNDAIFKEIGLKTEDEVYDFCVNAYGYCPYPGFWPEYKYDDYDAATQVVIAIYKEIERLEFDGLVSTAKDGSVSVQENPTLTGAPIKDSDTIKITIKPIQTFKIVL
jgi:hypothetical protein